MAVTLLSCDEWKNNKCEHVLFTAKLAGPALLLQSCISDDKAAPSAIIVFNYNSTDKLIAQEISSIVG